MDNWTRVYIHRHLNRLVMILQMKAFSILCRRVMKHKSILNYQSMRLDSAIANYHVLSPFSPEGSTKMALIGQVVSENKLFDNNGNIHVCSPGERPDNSRGHIFS